MKEITLPMFIDALEQGETGGRFSAEGDKPDDGNADPRPDLLQLDAYDSMSVVLQGCRSTASSATSSFSRCQPAPRYLSSWWPSQSLYDLVRCSIFLVDDNARQQTQRQLLL